VLSGPVPDELSTTLTADCVCDEPISRRAIEVWSLVAQMLEQFQGPAPDFKTCRRRMQNGPGGGPTASEPQHQGSRAGRTRGWQGKIKYCSNCNATGRHD